MSTHTHRPQRLDASRIIVWSLFALALIAAPLFFQSSLGRSILSQVGYLIIILLSYNILLGQGGMLSFGHAVYTGLGGFAAIHAINIFTDQKLPVPLMAVPLIGGLMGALVAFVLGYVTTKKSGTTFAMITLGIGELVAAMSLMFPNLTGGDAGITTNRVYGSPFLGASFGPQIQVYYLIAAYCFVCTALMFAFTGTPLGRVLNAVRDNPERVEFIGYNTQLVRWFAFIVSGFFAGIGGALAAINFEIVNASDVLSGLRSGSFLLFTFLGGAGFFFGPIIGAVLLVVISVLLSEITKAWLLYLGLIFLLMVMFAPGGIASLIMMNLRVVRFGKFRRLVWPYVGLVLAAVPLIAGIAALVEMVYHIQLNSAQGPMVEFGGLELDTAGIASWAGAVVALVVGAALLEAARRQFARAWGSAQEEIEVEVKQLEAKAA